MNSTKKGQDNRNKIRKLLVTYPGITGVEISELLNLSTSSVSRHITKIKAGWKAMNLSMMLSKIGDEND